MTTNLTAEDSVKRIRVSKIEFERRAPYLPDSRHPLKVPRNDKIADSPKVAGRLPISGDDSPSHKQWGIGPA